MKRVIAQPTGHQCLEALPACQQASVRQVQIAELLIFTFHRCKVKEFKSLHGSKLLVAMTHPAQPLYLVLQHSRGETLQSTRPGTGLLAALTDSELKF